MGVLKDKIIEEDQEAGYMEDAVQEFFATGYYSWKGWSKEEREEIEQRAATMWDDFDAGDLPGWRD